jgi:hypothetical protein
LDKIQFLVENISSIDLNAPSFKNTWFPLFAPSSIALKKNTLGR